MWQCVSRLLSVLLLQDEGDLAGRLLCLLVNLAERPGDGGPEVDLEALAASTADPGALLRTLGSCCHSSNCGLRSAHLTNQDLGKSVSELPRVSMSHMYSRAPCCGP